MLDASNCQIPSLSIKVAFLQNGNIDSIISPKDKESKSPIKTICHKNWKAVAHSVFKIKDSQEDLCDMLGCSVARKFAAYYKGTNSILKSKSPEEFAAFSNKFNVEECRAMCPLWYASVTGACGANKSKAKVVEATNSVALATATTARFQNREMSAIATRISTILLHSGAHSKDFSKLQKLGVCISHKRL